MNCKIQKSKLNGKIICPSNKSYTHRAIFLAALSDGKSIVKKILHSNDTVATISACRGFGVEVEEVENNVTIKNKIGETVQSSIINAENSGTTIRIAIAIAALSGGNTTLTGDDSLKKRPMQPILDALERMGVKTESNEGRPPIHINGKIQGKEISINGDISSQFISALLIIAPRLPDGLIINVEGKLVSKPYVDLTIAIMKKFGVDVKIEEEYKKYVVSHQIYKPTTFSIPSDFSNLALLLAANVLLGDGLDIEISLGDMPQGDEAIVDILEKLGVNVTLEDDIITTESPISLKGGKFDLSDTPDLLPAIAILALKSEKPIEMFNVKHARYKETDRIAIISRELKKIGLNVEEKDDGMILKKSSELIPAELNSENDHRLFMAFSIAGMFVGECTVSDPDAVKVSYPEFISDLVNVGAKIN
ncbi:MAG: 3-phosphoshikimate 1-carboxyvinyltransferase [Thaumarchaeota archaeon]|jgi:3-phosphoshikimate 1-carboxyvinyltransferase|nr:3-phosphoshikimate 1-carboxyvinyltransferase [Nitrososphaerota archaeon]|tara:strand:- start:489 stop:1751 length:1263 start_codon:yes stop_codon:yes gene_type:complete